MGIGEFPQQAENRFRVTKALLAEEWFQKSGSKLTLFAIKIIISSEKQHNKGSH